jgi:hypothetical protein
MKSWTEAELLAEIERAGITRHDAQLRFAAVVGMPAVEFGTVENADIIIGGHLAHTDARRAAPPVRNLQPVCIARAIVSRGDCKAAAARRLHGLRDERQGGEVGDEREARCLMCQ